VLRARQGRRLTQVSGVAGMCLLATGATALMLTVGGTQVDTTTLITSPYAPEPTRGPVLVETPRNTGVRPSDDNSVTGFSRGRSYGTILPGGSAPARTSPDGPTRAGAPPAGVGQAVQPGQPGEPPVGEPGEPTPIPSPSPSVTPGVGTTPVVRPPVVVGTPVPQPGPSLPVPTPLPPPVTPPSKPSTPVPSKPPVPSTPPLPSKILPDGTVPTAKPTNPVPLTTVPTGAPVIKVPSRKITQPRPEPRISVPGTPVRPSRPAVTTTRPVPSIPAIPRRPVSAEAPEVTFHRSFRDNVTTSWRSRR
jgi:hypothetical protein